MLVANFRLVSCYQDRAMIVKCGMICIHTCCCFCLFPDWYRGNKSGNRLVKGIFPKNYVHIKESVVEKAAG